MTDAPADLSPVARTVAAAPPLSESTRSTLAALLRSGGSR